MSYEGENLPGAEPADAAAGASGAAPLEVQPAAEPEAEGGPGDELTLDLPAADEPEADVPEVRADEGGDEFAAPIAEDPDVPDEVPPKEWYILKVQSNREDSIAEALRRRVAKEGFEPYFDEILVPVEKVTEFKNGKKRVVRRKLYPGYILVHMAFTLETKALVRETPGIGDFTGPSGKPLPMHEHEVKKILVKQQEKTDEAPRLKISFKSGDRVKIKEGHFENFEGDVQSIDEANGRVTVIISIFGRSTPVELDYWQIEAI